MEAKKSEEIDLLDVMATVAWAIRRNFKLLMILTIVGFAIGFAASFMAKKQYESKMIVSTDILTFSYVEMIVSTLNELIGENNKAEIQKRLNTSPEVAAKLLNLSVDMLIRNKRDAPESEKVDLVITAKTLDNDILLELQTGLLQCLTNHDYVRVRVEQRKNFFSTLIAGIDKEIVSLEQLKTKIYSGEFFQGMKGDINFDPTTVNSKIIELSKTKLEYTNNLQLVESVQVIEPFTPHYKPVTGRMVRSSVLAGLVGLLLGLMIVALKGLDRTLNKFQKQQV